MRVAFVDQSAAPGGGQLGLARYLSATRGLEPTGVILSGGVAFDSVPKDRIVMLGASESRWGFLVSVPRLLRHLRESRYDVVVANSTKAAFVVAAAPRRRDCVRIFYLRSDLDPRRMSRLKYWAISRLVVTRFDAYLANSEWTSSTLPESVSSKPRAVAYPVSGLAVDVVSPRPVQTESATTLRIVSLSRIVRWKGIDVLLDAIEELNSQGWRERIEVVIAGAAHHHDAEYEQTVRQRVAREFPNVRMVGHVDNVPGLLAGADVLVLASIDPEPFGQVIVQAMAAGVVVLASNLGGPREIIEGDVSGVFFEPGDSIGLAARLRELADHPGHRRQLAENAVRSSERFNDQSTVAALDAAVLHLYAVVSRRTADPAGTS